MELIAQFPLGVLFSSNIPRPWCTKIQRHFFKAHTILQQREKRSHVEENKMEKYSFNYTVNLWLSPLRWECLKTRIPNRLNF